MARTIHISLQRVLSHTAGRPVADGVDRVRPSLRADGRPLFDVWRNIVCRWSSGEVLFIFNCPLVFRATDLPQIVDTGVALGAAYYPDGSIGLRINHVSGHECERKCDCDKFG